MTIPVQHDDDDFYINTTLADAQATIAALQAQLATCFKLSGADPDGNEDWRLAPHAVEEVTRLRNDCDELGDETGALREQLTRRTAELEAAKRERDEWIVKWDEHDHYPKGYVTAQIQLRERVQAELERVRDQYADLRKMVLALPKVEGQFEVGSGACYYVRALDGKSNPIICGLMTEQAVAYAILALLKHRQGME
jgi:hypothetical protein